MVEPRFKTWSVWFQNAREPELYASPASPGAIWRVVSDIRRHLIQFPLSHNPSRVAQQLATRMMTMLITIITKRIPEPRRMLMSLPVLSLIFRTLSSLSSYRWENRGSETLSNLPSDTYTVSGRTEILTQLKMGSLIVLNPLDLWGLTDIKNVKGLGHSKHSITGSYHHHHHHHGNFRSYDWWMFSRLRKRIGYTFVWWALFYLLHCRAREWVENENIFLFPYWSLIKISSHLVYKSFIAVIN